MIDEADYAISCCVTLRSTSVTSKYRLASGLLLIPKMSTSLNIKHGSSHDAHCPLSQRRPLTFLLIFFPFLGQDPLFKFFPHIARNVSEWIYADSRRVHTFHARRRHARYSPSHLDVVHSHLTDWLQFHLIHPVVWGMSGFSSRVHLDTTLVALIVMLQIYTRA